MVTLSTKCQYLTFPFLLCFSIIITSILLPGFPLLMFFLPVIFHEYVSRFLMAQTHCEVPYKKSKRERVSNVGEVGEVNCVF